MSQLTMLAYILVVFLFAICPINGLVYDEKEFTVAESKCPEIAVDPSLNMTWLKSADYWYSPLLSKKDIFMFVKLSTSPEEFANITEDTLKNSCQLFTGINYHKSKVEWFGLERKFSEWEYSLRPKRDGIIDYFRNNVHMVTTRIVLTDNEHYYLGVDKFKDGSKEYYVATVSDNIPVGEMDKIYKKIDSLGFPVSRTYALKSNCDQDEFIKSVKQMLKLK